MATWERYGLRTKLSKQITLEHSESGCNPFDIAKHITLEHCNCSAVPSRPVGCTAGHINKTNKQIIKIGDFQGTTTFRRLFFPSPLKAALHTPHTIISKSYQQFADGHAAIKHTSLETSTESTRLLNKINTNPHASQNTHRVLHYEAPR